MKKYIALSTSSNVSGPKSREEAEKWAAKEMANKPHIECVFLAEVVGELRRITPIVEFVPVAIEEEKPEGEKPLLVAAE